MSYLVVKSASNATPESYLLTSTTNGPRIAVGGSYIPLSTDMGGGSYEVKVGDGNTTYHVMRTSTSSYSQSASASTTFNTTANSPDGLESVTNLTRVSTSNTVYQTRASTSATLTRASTSATLTRASTYETLTRASTYETLTRASTYETLTRASTYGWDYLTGYGTNTVLWATNAQVWNTQTNYSTYATYSESTVATISNSYTYRKTYSMIMYGTIYTTQSYTSACDGYYTYGSRTTSENRWNTNPSWFYQSVETMITGTTYYTQVSVYGYNTRESVYGYNTRQSVYGYNTRESVSGYATRESISGYGTRASTSNTVYETRESISGYSGVSTSSSSSSESASGTCWK